MVGLWVVGHSCREGPWGGAASQRSTWSGLGCGGGPGGGQPASRAGGVRRGSLVPVGGGGPLGWGSSIGTGTLRTPCAPARSQHRHILAAACGAHLWLWVQRPRACVHLRSALVLHRAPATSVDTAPCTYDQCGYCTVHLRSAMVLHCAPTICAGTAPCTCDQRWYCLPHTPLAAETKGVPVERVEVLFARHPIWGK